VAVASASEGSKVTNFPYAPNPAWTNGDICDLKDPDYSERRYPEQIAYCQRNVTVQMKVRIYDLYGVPTHCRTQYTIDHFIPLSIGGTNDLRNLWPEAKAVKKARQNLEVDVYKRLARGDITQAQAIDIVLKAKWNPPVDQIDPQQICLH
jgi:hypothetical protein